MAGTLAEYRIQRVTGDRYAGGFVSEGFRTLGIHYIPSRKSKSELYVDLLGRLCSRQLELLDDEVAIKQIAGLERRTRSGGADKIDHGPGQHDDLANAIAGVCDVTSKPRKQVGSWRTTGDEEGRARMSRLEFAHEMSRRGATIRTIPIFED